MMSAVRFRIYLCSSRKYSLLPFFSPCTISFKKFCSYLGKWKVPEGHDSGITVYNSAVNEVVPLIVQNKGLVTWYMCGPTVYDSSHIGHASCFVKFDIIRRILENLFNINVILLMGITDIDDKIIRKSKEVGLNASQLAKQYELDFFKDMAAMRVMPPTTVAHVTENIPQIISFCQKLIHKKVAYVTEEGNVYFMVSKGISADISNQMTENIEVVSDPLKQDQRDFALWKAAKADEPYWISPWGKGRPGWHIECSVMASKAFGSQLDLHSGGYDLLFPHHANEKSQSEAYHECSQWVNYWLHSGLLQIDDDAKMSKSKGNTISIKEFLSKNCANDFRFLCLQSPYRKNITFNNETLSGAKALHKKFHNFINESELYISGEVSCPVIDENKLLTKLSMTKERISSLLANDFNTSQAVLCLTALMDDVYKCLQFPANPSATSSNITAIAACSNYVNSILETLGINITCKKRLPRDFIYAVDVIIEFRNQIRLLAVQVKNGAASKGNISASEYISSYKSLNRKLSGLLESKDSLINIADLVTASEILYNKTLNFIADIGQLRDESSIKNWVPSKDKEIMICLFTFCDEHRSVLQKYGIAVKDREDSSIWIPLINLHV